MLDDRQPFTTGSIISGSYAPLMGQMDVPLPEMFFTIPVGQHIELEEGDTFCVKRARGTYEVAGRYLATGRVKLSGPLVWAPIEDVDVLEHFKSQRIVAAGSIWQEVGHDVARNFLPLLLGCLLFGSFELWLSQFPEAFMISLYVIFGLLGSITAYALRKIIPEALEEISTFAHARGWLRSEISREARLD